LTLLLIAVSEPIVRVVFQRGAFTAETTAIVSRVQICYLLQLPFFVPGLVAVRLLSAMNGNRLISAIAACNMIVNIAGNYLFMRWFGVAGIAASTSLVYAVSTALIFFAVTLRLNSAMSAEAMTSAGPAFLSLSALESSVLTKESQAA
jgi:putative peptidoglycan lipid II flippase